MRKVLLVAAIAAGVALLSADVAFARGGRGGCGSSCGSSCYTSCYSGCGYSSYCGSSCYSSYSCGSSCYSGYSYGCGSSCYSGGSSCYSYAPSYSAPSCYGGYCGLASAGVPYSGAAYAAAPTTSATLVVNMPAEAALTVDGAATVQKSAVRTFKTPALEAGKEFAYTLTATVERDGKMETVTKKVTVKAGETTRVSLDMPTDAVAAK